MNDRYVALIPAYEPDMFLVDLIVHLNESGFEIVLVDDGSGPGYSMIFEKAASMATLLTHEENRGKGRALKTGLAFIREHYGSDTVIVTVDADGQHRVEDAIKLCERASKNPDTLVLGKRSLQENVPLRSRFGNTMTRLIYRMSTGVKVYDTQTGLRAFHIDMLPQLIEVAGERYEYEMNVLLEFPGKNIPIVEEDIETIYINDNAGSHFNPLKDSVRIYKELLKFSLSSFAGFIVDYLMYSLLIFLTGNLVASNIGARVVSASVNFTINRKFVFKSEVSILRSAFFYFLLAAAILAGNTIVLRFFVDICGINSMAAKLITEIMFFVVSWLAQKFIVFRKNQNTAFRHTNTQKRMLNINDA